MKCRNIHIKLVTAYVAIHILKIKHKYAYKTFPNIMITPYSHTHAHKHTHTHAHKHTHTAYTIACIHLLTHTPSRAKMHTTHR